MQEPGRRQSIPARLARLASLEVVIVGHAVGTDGADLLRGRFWTRRHRIADQRANLPDLTAHLDIAELGQGKQAEAEPDDDRVPLGFHDDLNACERRARWRA